MAGFGFGAARHRRAAGAGYPAFPLGTRLSVLGDSLTAHGVTGSWPGSVRKLITGEIEQAQAIRPRFSFENWPADTATRDSGYLVQNTEGANRAVSGSPATFHATLLPATLAMGAPVMIYSATVNSVTIPNAETYTIENILLPAIAAGRYVLIGTVRPWASTASFDNATNRAARLRINTALRAFAAAQGPAKCLLLDWDAPYDAAGSGLAAGDLFYDKLHLNPYGAALGAAYLNGRLDLILPAGNIFLDRVAAVANRQANPLLTGTGGARGGTVQSGSIIPAGYRAVSGGSSATTAVVGVEANPVTGGQSAVFTMTPNASSIANESFQLLFGTTGLVDLPDLAGKYVASFAEVEIAASPFIGIPTVYCVDGGDGSRYARGADYDPAYGELTGDGLARTYFISTDPVQLSDPTTGVKTIVLIRCNGMAANAAGAAPMVAKVKRIWMGEVGDPKLRWAG